MKFDLSLEQYEIIYRVVSSLGSKFSHGAGSSCQFYNVNAAYLIKSIFNIEARPVMGAAFILLNDNKFILSFAEKDGDKFYSSPNGFHCWVETENSFIDFTAPEYSETAVCKKHNQIIPKKMFQKNKHAMSTDPYSLNDVGDFYFCANESLTERLIYQIYSTPAYEDFADICFQWCKDILKNNTKTLPIMDDLGNETKINLISSNLVDAW
tara:strand:+ start:5673 stop:6302 length:630 start_codon:yes stop_codon:yes gene_type:complete